MARLVGLPSTASLDEESFNPNSIVNDLRRAIDQSDVRLMGYKTVETGFLPRQEPIFQRFISGPKVVKALDNLTAAQIQRVREVYEAQEKRSLDKDLFGTGESGYPSDLTEEERGHIGALLGGTRAEAQQPGSPKPETPEGRFEADAIVLHDLLDGDLKGANLEKVMAMHRRPGREIDRVDSHYARRYGKELGSVLGDKLDGLQRSRMYFLRGEDWTKADACAIEAKRQAILQLEAARPDDGLLSSAVSLAGGPSANTGAIIDAGRKALEGDIEQILEQNKREATGRPRERRQERRSGRAGAPQRHPLGPRARTRRRASARSSRRRSAPRAAWPSTRWSRATWCAPPRARCSRWRRARASAPTRSP